MEEKEIGPTKRASNRFRKAIRLEWKHELPGRDQKFELDGKGKNVKLVSNRHLAHELAVQEKPHELPG
jgi:hypothetical protein